MRFILAMLVIASCGLNKKAADKADKKNVEFFPVAEMEEKDGAPDHTLIGAKPADLADWPASMYADMGGARCTATLIGERSLMIAAHCVDSGASASFTIKGVRYTSVCTHSREYAGNPTADYTLCQVDRKVEGVLFEVLNQDPDFVKLGDNILLTGYGCVQPGGGGGNDGIYRIGEATVTDVPAGSSNDIITRGGAALCFGDSGGPAFKYLDSTKKGRKMISINSRGDIATTSYLSAVATTEGRRFVKAWSDLTKEKICGVHPEAVNCRGLSVPPPSPTPPPPPSPEPSPQPGDCKKTYDTVGICMFQPQNVGTANCYKEVGKIFKCLDQVISKFKY